MNVIEVVGLGLGTGDVGPAARELIGAAGVLAGGPRLLEMFPDHPGRRLVLAGDLDGWLDEVALAAGSESVAVLASGDPNFFGVAARVMDRVGRENVRLHPNVTAVQGAFARLKESWAGAVVVSLHGREEEALFDALAGSERVAVYTDPVHTPGRIARGLINRGQTGWRMWVMEDLGRPGERAACYDLEQASGLEFSTLNIVVLVREETPRPLYLGTPDPEFVHEAGLITKAEVRAVALSRLELAPEMTLWDLGAGCGSIGIEATLLLPRGRVVAVERRPERIRQIEANRARFGAANLDVIQGELPGVMSRLPDPDRIFVGGGGAALREIVKAGAGRLPAGGVMVVAAVRLDGLEEARRAMSGPELEVEVVQVQVGRGTPVGDDLYLKALNPVWLIRGRKTSA